MKIITDEKCTGYVRAGHPERPQRITSTVEHLKGQSELALNWVAPSTVNDGQILRAHAPEMLARQKIPQDFDADTPFFDNISGCARASVAAALDALKLARAGENVFSLMRPPGHHATRRNSMGFCYLNNIAIAVLEALATGSRHVAVLDFRQPLHHGSLARKTFLLNRPGNRIFHPPEFPPIPARVKKTLATIVLIIRLHLLHRAKSIWPRLPGRWPTSRIFRPILLRCPPVLTPMFAIRLLQGTLLGEDFRWLGRELHALKIQHFLACLKAVTAVICLN